MLGKDLTISVIDFFCGCGGTSAGLREAGMNIVAGIDNDTKALKTFEENFPGANPINVDITRLTAKYLFSKYGDVPRPILMAACAPCQPFSKQNRNKSEDDNRIDLLNEFHRFVRRFKPEYIVLENVPGMQKLDTGPLNRFCSFLESMDYQFDVDIKDAKDYGVPQSRRRLVLIASKLGEICLPPETHGEGLLDYKTVMQTIESYPPLGVGEKCELTPNHETANISDLNIERLKHTPEGGDRRDWPDRLVLKCHKRKVGYTDTYGRLWGNKPARTLTTKCISISNGRFAHPVQDRGISVREAAALQSFPDEFVFYGSRGETAKQVGNAVPVDFAKALGLQIKDHYKEYING